MAGGAKAAKKETKKEEIFLFNTIALVELFIAAEDPKPETWRTSELRRAKRECDERPSLPLGFLPN